MNYFKTTASMTVLLAMIFVGAGANAADFKAYSKSDFDTAQKSGKPILIEISAEWCPTCHAQKPIIQSLADQPDYKNLVIFEVDFDSMKDVVAGFGARQQSTLIAFKGQAETARSVGQTKKADIEALFVSTKG